jgi:hypothetical protein
VFRTISSSRHADAITPTEPLGAVAVSPSGIGLPLNSGGSASAIVLFEACSAFTHVSACLFARSPKVTFTQSTSTHVVTSLRRSGCFRPSDRLAGWDSHPLEIADFTAYWFVDQFLVLFYVSRLRRCRQSPQTSAERRSPVEESCCFSVRIAGGIYLSRRLNLVKNARRKLHLNRGADRQRVSLDGVQVAAESPVLSTG